MKHLNNQNGIALVIAICILALITLLATSAIMTSRTEVMIATNHQIYSLNFYAAESGIQVSPLWAKIGYPESEWGNVDYVGSGEGNLSNNTSYDFEVRPQVQVDPVDNTLKVLRYGDEDGDYLNELNFTTGPPLIKVISNGTHIRGGLSKIKATFIFEPIFMMPDSAIRINSNLNGNGVSGSIVGEHQSGSECGDVADIMYDVEGGVIDYGGDLGDTPRIEKSGGMYPMPLIKPAIIKRATQIIEGSNNIDEGSIITSAEDPGVIVINGNAKTTNLSGYGILFVDGDFEFAGGLDWHGLIIVVGNITFSGGGSKIIYGAVIGGGDAVALNGSVDVQYDCDLLSQLYDDFSDYKMMSWRQL